MKIYKIYVDSKFFLYTSSLAAVKSLESDEQIQKCKLSPSEFQYFRFPIL